MTVEQLAKKLDELISPELSESWDNDGIDVMPNPNAEVTRVLCALDCTTEAINTARVWGCNVIVTHHPLIYKPLGSVTAEESVGKRVIQCIKHGIAVISFHTRLDIMEGGVNDKLAERLGIKNTEAFIPYGRIGDIAETPLDYFAENVANGLDIPKSALTIVDANKYPKRVAVVSGSGKSDIYSAIAAGADTFVTGEVSHSQYIDCKEMGLNLICATHYATERIVLPVLSNIVEQTGAKADVLMFKPSNEFGYPYPPINDEE